MSTYLKILIPMLDSKLKKEDLTEESGFVDAYTADKNRPYLENTIFLMYDLSIKNKIANEREYRMRSCKNISNSTIEYINGKAYKIYAFPLVEKDAKDVFKGFKPRSIKGANRVLSFWCGSDNSVNLTMLDRSVTKLYLDWRSVPEYDYLPELKIGFSDIYTAA